MSDMGPWVRGGVPLTQTAADPAGDVQLGGLTDFDSRTIGTRRVSSQRPDLNPFDRNRGGRQRGGPWRPSTQVRKQSVRKLLSDLRALDSNRLADLQLRMVNAGLFGDKQPTWGYLTQETTAAYMELLSEAATRPDQTVVEVLDQLEESSLRGLDPEQILSDNDGEAGDVVQLSDPESISASADELAKKILGRKLTAKQKEFLVEWTHGQERGSQKTRNDARRAAEPGDPRDVKDTDIDAFMDAISGRESNGNPTARNDRTGAYGEFQIMPSNWPKWAPLAGLPSSAAQTPDNQKKVARAVMTMYYKKFGNWRDVAIAWYAGPGASADPASRDRNRKQGRGNEPSINEYANNVMGRMQSRRALGPQRSSLDGVSSEITDFDPDASLEAAVRRLDPAAAGASDFASTARDFESLLGGGA